jgi:hypothetical protein
VSDDIQPGEGGRRGLICVAIIYLLFLFAWCATHGKVREFSEGSSIDAVVSRCAVYRRCCRPSCRFAEALSNG